MLLLLPVISSTLAQILLEADARTGWNVHMIYYGRSRETEWDGNQERLVKLLDCDLSPIWNEGKKEGGLGAIGAGFSIVMKS